MSRVAGYWFFGQLAAIISVALFHPDTVALLVGALGSTLVIAWITR